MFDPSKIDLNLEDNKDENKKSTEELEKLESKDVLDDLNIPKLETKEEDTLENILFPEIISDSTEEKIVEEKSEVISVAGPGKNDDKKIIFDINLNSIDILLDILVDKEYDFATFEPNEESVKVTFRKNKVIIDTKYIKFPVYSNILLKAKALTKLTLEETENEQEGEGIGKIKNKNYKIKTKVVPSDLGAKLFIKTTESREQIIKKGDKKISLSKIFTFLGVIAFITLIVGGAFVSFVVLNAKTVEDVIFFSSLGINLNDINVFLGQIIAFIFSVLIFLETTFLIVHLFKFFLTKKEFKQKKIRYGIISTIILVFTFSTASGWMVIDKKIRALPNWQEMAYGDVQIYDNSKLLSETFDKAGAILKDTSNLIGPVEIKFDLTFYAKSEERKGLTIKKYIWDFGDGKIEETPVPVIIHNFKVKGNHEVKLSIEQTDIGGKIVEKSVEGIPNINLSYVVKINEKTLNNGGKIVEFDATSLKELGKIEWYFMDDLNTPKYTGEYFRLGTPIFEETLVGMYIKNNDKVSEELDKLFIISGENETNLGGTINYERSLIDDFEFEIWVEDLQNDFGKGYIEEFKWIIGDKEITKVGDVNNPTESSKIKFKFDSYGNKDIKVIIKDSSGETKELMTTLEIPKILKLSSPLKILNNDILLENVNYEKELNDYYINQIGIPTSLKFDARFVRTDNLLYTLNNVDWDYNSDGDIDDSGKIGNYEVNTEGNHTITLYYEFVNRKIPDDIIKMKEQIFIEGLKKEAMVDFDIIKDSSYVPVIVGFDASKSQVKGENIEKFIWDYGDGFIDEKDSIVEGHKYSTPGNYDVKLTVITTSGKEFSITKKLILKPKPQAVKISVSMKSAPIGQGIDFTSEESEGQITSYFWNFGDGNTSTEANPTHSYKKEGEYNVSLKLDFSNKNILDDNIKINIFKE